jgi:hypothetical protein
MSKTTTETTPKVETIKSIYCDAIANQDLTISNYQITKDQKVFLKKTLRKAKDETKPENYQITKKVRSGKDTFTEKTVEIENKDIWETLIFIGQSGSKTEKYNKWLSIPPSQTQLFTQNNLI